MIRSLRSDKHFEKVSTFSRPIRRRLWPEPEPVQNYCCKRPSGALRSCNTVCTLIGAPSFSNTMLRGEQKRRKWFLSGVRCANQAITASRCATLGVKLATMKTVLQPFKLAPLDLGGNHSTLTLHNAHSLACELVTGALESKF
eukprot:6209595-Pleurochrysis_carterae.AAC.6